MKKKIFSILLSLCMVLTMIPVAAGTVWAEENSVSIGVSTLSADTPYYHNGTNGTMGTVDNTPTDANATFNSTDGTLTLSGLNLTSGNISATGNLTIKLEGENTLGSESYGSNVIKVNNGTLEIKGSGALTAENASGVTTTIYVGGNITINDGAKVTAIHAGGEAQAIHASGQGKITISGAGTEVTGTHNGTGSSTSTDYVALKAGTIQISDGAKLTAKGEAKAVDGTLSVNPLENYKIYAGDSQDSAAEQPNPTADLTALSAYKYLKFEPKTAASTALEDITFEYAYDVQRTPPYPAAVGAEITTSGFDKPLIGADGSRANSNEGNWKLTKVGTYSYVKSQTLNNLNQTYFEEIVNAVFSKYSQYSQLDKEEIVIHELKNGDAHIAYGVVIAYDAAEGKAVFLGDTWENGGCYLLSASEISESTSEIKIKAGQIATDFVQNISSISLGATGTHTFSEATVGYEAQTPLEVTVTNNGNVATGNLNVALSGGEASNFTVEPSTIDSIGNKNGTATFTVAPNTGLSAGIHTATVTVSGQNIVAQSFNVIFTVKAAVTNKLTSIAVTTAPTKTNYTAGETFDHTGMVVAATYSDGTTKEVTDYTFTPNAALTTNDARITISYTEGGVTQTTTQDITVNAREYSITVTDGKATQGEGTEIGEAAEGTEITLTANAAPSGKEFDKWVDENGNINLAEANSATTTFTMPAGAVSVKATYKDVPHTGGGSHSSSIQKPTIIAGEGAETSLSILGTNLTIKMTEGYELTDVILNGVSKGKVTELTGLRTGDKVEVKTEKKQEKPSKEEIIAALDSSKLVARSKLITLENGKKAVRVTWYDQNGNEIDFDGIEVYRSVKRYKGYGLEPFYTTKGDKSEGYYVNTKDLKEGTTYYYKVRGYVTIDGQKYYTDYSLKAIRTIK